MSRPTVSRSFWPWSIRLNLARFVLSQSCSVFFCVVSRRLRIISFVVSFSNATSPRASTVIDRVRLPCVTAVATSAIARTCDVRCAANLRLSAELALDAHFARDARHLFGECRERVDHAVDRVSECSDLAFRINCELLL